MNQRRDNETDRTNTETSMGDALLALALSEPTESHCPELEDIVAWHEKTLSVVDSICVKNHVARCDRCFQLWMRSAGPAQLETESVWERLSQYAGLMLGSTRTGSGALEIMGFPRRALFTAFLTIVIAVGITMSVVMSPDPLVPYVVELTGGAQTHRGEHTIRDLIDPGVTKADMDDPVPFVIFNVGNRFEITLRPRYDINDELDLGTYLRRDGVVEPLATPAPEITHHGVVILRGTVGEDVDLPLGKSELLIVIGRQDHLPGALKLDKQLAIDSSHAERDWSAFRLQVERLE